MRGGRPHVFKMPTHYPRPWVTATLRGLYYSATWEQAMAAAMKDARR